jgi:hypothetical protein
MQLVKARFGLYSAGAGRGGAAFFTHIGRFVFGAAVGTSLVTGSHKAHTFRRPEPQAAQWNATRIKITAPAGGRI